MQGLTFKRVVRFMKCLTAMVPRTFLALRRMREGRPFVHQDEAALWLILDFC